MNSCTRVSKFLAEYAANELTADERDRFEAHLYGCSRCAEEVAAYLEIIPLARMLPRIPMPPEVEARLREVLHKARVGRTVDWGSDAFVLW